MSKDRFEVLTVPSENYHFISLQRLKELKEAAIGVLVLSCFPPGMLDDNPGPSDDLIPALLYTAHRTTYKYGSPGAVYDSKNMGQSLPLSHAHDSYPRALEAWTHLPIPNGTHSTRKTR
ncbi:Glycoprotein endo-alpha-1,2-mannosidase-like protein [Sciurus carolinensis]|uniref:Glycoprotein endo-alpha-1,2-mannosidase-like protein n=1 Tax=Sciurus carolinensis TaxID=30640 RepID=A0AA41SV19_SCICA|nr:Glycoprotein endo-alpha-1,2-mannosidase-like protein [Sciurus carolinensis]